MAKHGDLYTSIHVFLYLGPAVQSNISYRYSKFLAKHLFSLQVHIESMCAILLFWQKLLTFAGKKWQCFLVQYRFENVSFP